jgi:chemotaxis protein MotB
MSSSATSHIRSAIVNAKPYLFLFLVASMSGACVTTGTHEAKVKELNQVITDTMAREQAAGAERDQLRRQLNAANAQLNDIKQRLAKLGESFESLTSESGQLKAGLQDAEQRLEELRKAKAAAEARAATFRTLVEKLRSMIDSGQIKVTIRNGRMLIALPNDVLFDSGKTAVKAEGKAAIAKIAQVLTTIPDRRFLVVGHTDNVPIKTARFRSNWELSTARAVEVAQLLLTGGMKPEVLGAAGYAEFDPAGPNDSAEGKAQNRRIEIVLEPNLSDLPNLDNLLAGDVKKP